METMKYKGHIKIKYNCQIGALLSDESMAALNNLFNTHYSRQFSKGTRISRKQKGFKFWDKLMRERKAVRL